MPQLPSLAIDRRAFLLVLGGLHIIALLSFGPRKVLVDAPKPSFFTLVPVRQPPAPRQAPPAQPRPARAAKVLPAQPPALVAPRTEDAPAMTVVATPVESAPRELVMDELKGRAGAIDKELRDKSFDLRERKKLAYERPKFERMMESAGKPRGDVIEEIVAPGGRRITRINGKCYYAPPTGLTAMHDPFKGGPPKITQANCPREK